MPAPDPLGPYGRRRSLADGARCRLAAVEGSIAAQPSRLLRRRLRLRRRRLRLRRRFRLLCRFRVESGEEAVAEGAHRPDRRVRLGSQAGAPAPALRSARSTFGSWEMIEIGTSWLAPSPLTIGSGWWSPTTIVYGVLAAVVLYEGDDGAHRVLDQRARRTLAALGSDPERAVKVFFSVGSWLKIDPLPTWFHGITLSRTRFQGMWLDDRVYDLGKRRGTSVGLGELELLRRGRTCTEVGHRRIRVGRWAVVADVVSFVDFFPSGSTFPLPARRDRWMGRRRRSDSRPAGTPG